MSRPGTSIPLREEGPAPVTVFDGLGRVVRIVTADEFRRSHGSIERPTLTAGRRRGEASAARGRLAPHQPTGSSNASMSSKGA
jgi:hypothetical protein